MKRRKTRQKKERSDLDESVRRLLAMVGEDSGEEECSSSRPAASPPVRRVYYCSRTHSQLAQVMAELEKIVQRNVDKLEGKVKAVTLASRKSTCLNARVTRLVSSEAINDKCQELLNEDDCPYYNDDKTASMEAMQKSLSALSVVDIEEVLAAGRRHETCAYYGARAFASSSANILALPYSMLLSRQTRKALEIDLRGSLVIFDEGHNIVDAVNELHSCSVALQGLVLLTGALRRYLAKFERRFAPANLILLQQLQQVLLRVSETLSRQEGDRKWGVNEFIADCKVDHINMLKIVDYIRDSHLSPKLASYFEDCNGVVGASQEGGGPPVAAVPNQTQLLSRFAEMMVSFIAADSDGRLFFTKASGLLRYVALNPAKAMDDITAAAHCVILAGGTMRPIDDVILQLFPQQRDQVVSFSCGHLPGMEKNILGLVVGTGPGGRPLRFVHSSRDDLTLCSELGQVLSNVCNVVSDGTVCFFASYRALDHFLANWTSRAAIEAKKKVFVEVAGGGPSETEKMLKNYQHAVFADRGALLLAVMGGRLSEGVNFSDRLARAVLIVGQPYPNLKDPETAERALYYSKLQGDEAAGAEYLENVCMRSVNQTIGRAIRHAGDYAVVMLLDERYGQGRLRSKLPGWIQPSLFPAANKSCDFSEAFAQLVTFFRNHRK